MNDYTLLYKSVLPAVGPWPDFKWSLFLSAFTSADRVQYVFNEATATRKTWLVFPEYGYLPTEYPAGSFSPDVRHEADFVNGLFQSLSVDLGNERICIDITGFIRPYLLFLLRYLREHGVRRFDAIYSEPVQYANRELTRFSDEDVVEVRQIAGFEGVHVPDTSNDILFIGSGYDHELIAQVAESKVQSRKVQVFGFPSLKPDMYQENVLRARRAEDAVGRECTSLFAPAYDPFVTAQVLSDFVARCEAQKPFTNLYLSPLSTKAQVLGFGLFYLVERMNSASSIIFPFCQAYAQETSTGVSRVWKYTIEFS